MSEDPGDRASDRHRPGVAHAPLRTAVSEELRRAIVEGRYRPGERLFEDQIAHDLDVSRNPVREALQALSLEGFVELEPRRGARVATVSRKRAEELFEVRECLEAQVARLAAQRRSPAQVERLRALVERGLSSTAEGQVDHLPQLNTEFHRALAEAAGNDLLAETLDRFSHVITWVYSKEIRRRFSASWQEHAKIVDAVHDGDADRAQELASEHIIRAREAYLSGSTT